METTDKDAVYIKSIFLMGFIHYFPHARNSDQKDQDDLEYGCRIAMDEELSPEERGKALGEVEAILKRLESE